MAQQLTQWIVFIEIYFVTDGVISELDSKNFCLIEFLYIFWIQMLFTELTMRLSVKYYSIIIKTITKFRDFYKS